MPPFTGAVTWVNGEPLLTVRLGSPVFIHFWALSCPACKVNMPALRALRLEFESNGLQFVAIHSPRVEEDRNSAAVAQAIVELGITEPCALDTDGALASAFGIGGK